MNGYQLALVVCHEHRRFRPVGYSYVSLADYDDPISVFTDGGISGINIALTTTTITLQTSILSEEDADNQFNTPSLILKDGTVTITYRLPGGGLVHYLIMRTGEL